MKRNILTFTFCLTFSYPIFSQKIVAADLPSAISQSYKSKFAIGTIAEKDSWEIDYDHYKVDFFINKIEYSASFDKDGNWLNTEIPTATANLPAEIKNTLKTDYRGFKVEDGIRIVSDKETIYKISVIKAEFTYSLTFTEKGEVLKKIEGLEVEKDDKD